MNKEALYKLAERFLILSGNLRVDNLDSHHSFLRRLDRLDWQKQTVKLRSQKYHSLQFSHLQCIVEDHM